MNIPAISNRILPLFQHLPRCLDTKDKLYQMALATFKGGSGLFFLACGTKEVCFDARCISQKEYSLSHGSFFLCSAVCTLLEAVHLFKIADLGKMYPVISWTGAYLFLFANFIGLEQCIRVFEEAKEMKDDNLMKSAVVGGISNFGYIAAAAIAILGGPAGIAFLIGCVSACFGGLKMMLDFYILMKETQQTVSLI